MITPEQFERGLRLDQYISSITQNKENFRANFIKAVEIFTDDDLAFFRSLPYKVNIAILSEDDNPDALRDVPLISRLSVEVGKLSLKLFRAATHADAARELMACPLDGDGDGDGAVDEHAARPMPVIAFMQPDMQLIDAHAGPHPDVLKEVHRRQQAWAESHPEVKDARESISKMTPITRTRVNQSLYALTPDQRVEWGRKAIAGWRKILTDLK
jgi:hypothetical protein